MIDQRRLTPSTKTLVPMFSISDEQPVMLVMADIRRFGLSRHIGGAPVRICVTCVDPAHAFALVLPPFRVVTSRGVPLDLVRQNSVEPSEDWSLYILSDAITEILHLDLAKDSVRALLNKELLRAPALPPASLLTHLTDPARPPIPAHDKASDIREVVDIFKVMARRYAGPRSAGAPKLAHLPCALDLLRLHGPSVGAKRARPAWADGEVL